MLWTLHSLFSALSDLFFLCSLQRKVVSFCSTAKFPTFQREKRRKSMSNVLTTWEYEKKIWKFKFSAFSAMKKKWSKRETLNFPLGGGEAATSVEKTENLSVAAGAASSSVASCSWAALWAASYASYANVLAATFPPFLSKNFLIGTRREVLRSDGR